MEDNLTIHPLLLWATVTQIKQERQLRQNKLEKSIRRRHYSLLFAQLTIQVSVKIGLRVENTLRKQS